MNYAIIENKTVTNIIVADKKFIDQWYPGAVFLEEGQFVSIGMTYEGGIFSWPEEEEEGESVPEDEILKE
jgi:hypothetical protein